MNEDALILPPPPLLTPRKLVSQQNYSSQDHCDDSGLTAKRFSLQGLKRIVGKIERGKKEVLYGKDRGKRQHSPRNRSSAQGNNAQQPRSGPLQVSKTLQETQLLGREVETIKERKYFSQ